MYKLIQCSTLKMVAVFKESFNEVSIKFKGFSRKFQGCFKNVVSMKIEGNFKAVFKEVSMVFEESVPDKLRWCFKKVSKEFQGKLYKGYFKKGSRVFKGRLKSVSREFSVGFKDI